MSLQGRVKDARECGAFVVGHGSPGDGGLFDQPLARASDPWTSKEAAIGAVSMIAEHQRSIIAALEIGPASKDGIAARSGLDGVQVCRRLPEMQARGLIELTGRAIASESGRHAREWRLAVTR